MAGAGALLGRAEELRAVRAALAADGCVVAGPAGVGKSRLAADAVAELGPGADVVRVVATASAAAMPFGAFEHLLPPTEGRAPTVPDLLAAIRGPDADRRTVLLVDDAHLLDDASAALLLAVSSTGSAVTLLTLRTQEPAPDAVTALWKERRIPRFDLQPLAPAEVRALVEALLGAPAGALLHDWAFELSQGNPLYVTELVEDAQRAGAVGLVDGRWHLTGDRPALHRLADLIRSHIRALPDAARGALEVLAIGSPLPLARLEGLSSAAAVEELERSRLAVVRADASGATAVELAHPLHGEVVQGDLPALATRRIRRELAEALRAAGPATEAEVLRGATWLLDAGEVDAAWFGVATGAALRRGAPALALRLAEAIPDDLAAALHVGRALNGLARFDDVDPALAPHEAAAAAAERAVGVDYVETRHRALLRADEAEGTAAATFLDRAVGWHDDPGWRALVDTQRAWADLYAGCPAQARARLRPHLDEPGVEAIRRFHLLTVSLLAATRLASVDDCEELDRRLRGVLEELDDPPWEVSLSRGLVEVARVSAARDLPGCLARLEAERLAAAAVGDRPGAATALYMLAVTHWAQGTRPRPRRTSARRPTSSAPGIP